MEEEFKPIICTICFNVKSAEDCRAIEESIRNALDAVLLKLPVEDASKSMICNACCTKLFEAFRFKAVCRDTEDSIFPYLNSKNEAPVDLKEIYLKKSGKEQSRSLLDDERICRLCLHIVTSGFTSAKNIEIYLIHIYISRKWYVVFYCTRELINNSILHKNLNFTSTEDPVVCKNCFESLKTHSGFIRNCLGIQKLENISEDDETGNQFDIKTEEIEIKSESSEENEALDPADEPANYEVKDNLNTQLEAGEYKCSMCSYQTTRKFNLIRHRLKHKSLSEIPTYKCDVCDYTTKRKRNLLHHQLTHKDISEIPKYKCDTCSYETKYKGVLARHRQGHGVPGPQVHKCHMCDYETKRKGRLLHHQLKHKNRTEVQLYKCDTCNFETRHKENLTRHGLIHKDASQVQIFKCRSCSFETKHRGNLANHELRHRDASEVLMQACDRCSYKTRHRDNLLQHRVTHADVCAMQLYKCEACSFETKRKGSLKRHALKHKKVVQL